MIGTFRSSEEAEAAMEVHFCTLKRARELLAAPSPMPRVFAEEAAKRLRIFLVPKEGGQDWDNYKYAYFVEHRKLNEPLYARVQKNGEYVYTYSRPTRSFKVCVGVDFHIVVCVGAPSTPHQ